MHIRLALIAPFKGLVLCFTQPEIRALSFWPWCLGAGAYILSLIGAYFAHGAILSSLFPNPISWWEQILSTLVSFLSGALLLVVGMFISLIFVLILTSVFQTAIAARVFTLFGQAVPPDSPGIGGMAKETLRTILAETFKLLWLMPLIILVFFIGLIPILTPFALMVGAWLLAYQFLDVALDALKIGAWRRLQIVMRYPLLTLGLGLSISLCWAVPFLGLLITPACAAGAAWLLQESEVLKKEGL